MKKWTHILLQFDSFIFQLKTNLVEEKRILLIFFWGLFILLAMLLQAIIALPLYIFLKPTTLKNQGVSEKEVKIFILKRQVTFSAIAVCILLVCLKVFFAGAVISLLFPSKKVAASTVSWAFGTPSEYVYDAGKIQIVDGIALFKASNPPQPSPTEPTTQVTPTSTIIETIITQIPNAVPTIEPVVAVTEVPAPTSAPIPVIETVTPIPQSTIAPQEIQTPASTTAPVVQESVPVVAPPPVEVPVAPVLGAETSCVATIQPVNALTVTSLDHWTSFNESAVTNGGSISYQLSDNNGQSWQYWTGVSWTAGDGWNSAGDINSHIILFPATGTLLFRAKMQSTCTQDMQLLGVTVDYNTKTALLPTAIPTVSLAVPTPTIEVTVPIATASSNLLQTAVTIQQPVPLFAPITVGATVASVGATITIPGSQGYNLPHIFSISGAFSLSALGTSTQLVAKAGSYSFGTSSDGKKLVLTLINTEGVTETIDAELPTLTGEQVNVAIATYDGTVVKLYVNGTLIGMKDLHTTIATSETTVNIGEGDLLTAHVNPFVLYNTVLTPEEIALRYLQVNNLPAKLVITGVDQIGGGDVKITYKLLDQNNHVLALDVYEYSTTGTFTGEQHMMTQDFDNSLHEGTHDLESSLIGTTHTFIWKAGNDVADLEHTKVYVKLRPFDGILAGQGSITSLSITTKPQTATITNVSQLANEKVQGHYALIGTDPNATVSLEISHDTGETWQSAATVTGDIGSVTTGLAKTFIWDAGHDLSGHEIANMKLRLKVIDSLGNSGYSSASESFDFDTQAPFGLADFHTVTTTQTTATLAWSPVISETHFKTYTVWYGKNQQDVDNEVRTAQIWTNTNNAKLSLQGTSVAVIPSLAENTTYFAKLVATDMFDHDRSLPVIQFTTGKQQITVIAPILNQLQSVATTTETTIPLSGIANAGATLALYINGNLSKQNWAIANSNGEFSGLVTPPLGSNAIAVIAHVDGDISPQSNTVTIDITIPVTQTPAENLPMPTISPTHIVATPTPQPVINQVIDTIGGIVDSIFGGAVTPTPTLEILPTVIPTAIPSITATVAPTVIPLETPIPLLPLHLPTPIASLLTPTIAIAPIETPIPEPIINQIIGGIGNVIENLLGISTPTPTEVLPVPTILPSITVPTNILTQTPASPTLTPVQTNLLTATPIITSTSTPTVATNTQTTNTAETTTTTTANTIINQFLGNQTGALPLIPVTTVQQNSLANPTSLANQLNRSVESKIIPAPVVTKIDQPATKDAVHLSGRGIPNSEVILYLFSQQAVIYKVPVKVDGTWEFYHDQSYVDLQPGQHSVYAVTLNAGSNVKSKPSLVKSFVVKKDWRVILAKIIDIPTTIMTMLLVVIGIVWIILRKKKK